MREREKEREQRASIQCVKTLTLCMSYLLNSYSPLFIPSKDSIFLMKIRETTNPTTAQLQGDVSFFTYSLLISFNLLLSSF